MSKAAPLILGSRSFDIQDQESFVHLSGDTNPIYVDAVIARRSMVGAVVVHGMHTVLWALEQLAKSPACPSGLSALDVRFPKPLYLGEEISFWLHSSDNGTERRLSAVVGEKTVASIRLDGQPLPQATEDIQDDMILPASAPRDLAFNDLAGQHGTVPYATTADHFAAAFPAAAARFGAPLLRDLAACSRLVGVHCPGLQSVFSRLSLSWQKRGSAAHVIYRVSETDARFNLVTIALQGAVFSGTIQAFSPEPPPRQLTMSELAQSIGSAEFAGQTALIIGGSRGLGELTAKAIAAGSGRVLITYAVGRDEAERVVEEIHQFGGDARCLPYDVSRPASMQLTGLESVHPTHVYYYATCQIFRAKTQTFDCTLLEHFMTFYVQGFHALCQALWDGGARGIACFYPSSIAVEDRPKGMTEYAMAKAAGEMLATDLDNLFPGYRSHLLRLPRLLTDQTSVVSPQSLPKAIDVLLPLLLAMQREQPLADQTVGSGTAA